MACRLVGSATPRTDACRGIQRQACLNSVLDQLDDVGSTLCERVVQRNAEIRRRGGDGDVPRLGGAGRVSWVTKLAAIFSRLEAVSMAASSTTPSCTRRCGKPPSPDRLPPSARDALSFMWLRASDQTRCGLVYSWTAGRQLLNLGPMVA
jgi:hypothetical protein